MKTQIHSLSQFDTRFLSHGKKFCDANGVKYVQFGGSLRRLTPKLKMSKKDRKRFVLHKLSLS